MTRKSPREIEHDIENLGGGRPPVDPATRYAHYQAEARRRWDAEEYDGDGGPLLKLWDAYGLAYDDIEPWAGMRRETIAIMIATDPRPSHSPPAPDGYDGALPVPTEDVGEAIAELESAFEVRVKRLTNQDTVTELPKAVDPDLLGWESDPPEFADLIAMGHDLF